MMGAYYHLARLKESLSTVKLTRSMTLKTITIQFGHHALQCPPSMYIILYAITSKKIGYDAEYDFLLETIWQYLINPMAYYAEQSLPFKDLLIRNIPCI
jgi:hypothetical protein